ncbi:sortase [Ruminococcus sp. CLA-AA-H200]|uniref:Sortase n=1 Tax=Ruminococcus turbiniformis TaxID=2881258 RepID=A0ABS8FWY3_9FIRM|nr:sortase [Ruminococcus turbiniformis]MCC2254546.1 sortase [Ruminococcus turbiniformis]
MRKFLNILLVSIMLTLLGLGVIELIKFHQVDSMNRELWEEVAEVPETPQDETGNSMDPDDPLYWHIDFDALQAVNPDIKGWIYIPGTRINYPILVGDTDQEYLSKDYNGNYLYAGSIFGYAGTDLLEDQYVQLFGHNMISKQMFGDLTNYQSTDYASHNSTMYIYLPDRTKQCRVFSAFGCRYDDPIFAEAHDDQQELITELSERSSIGAAQPEQPRQVFTLATCNGYTGTPNRFTVSFYTEKERFVL